MNERLRIFGVIVEDTIKAPTKENLKGYVILDTKTYQLKFLTVDQTKMMLGNYVFSNARIDKKGDVENTECSMNRVVPYDAKTKRPARQGVTVLGQVDGKQRYRVITQDGKVTTLDEPKIVELVKKGMPLINGKVVKRGDKGYVSSIKGTYPVIEERDRTEKLRSTAGTVGNAQDHKRQLEKLDRRFRISLVKYWSLNNWKVPDKDIRNLKDTKEHNKFKKGVERYYREYVARVHPDIVDQAEKLYGKVESTEKQFNVIKVAIYTEVLLKGQSKDILKPLKYIESEYVQGQLYGNKEFMKLASSVSATLFNFFKLMGMEAKLVYKIFENKSEFMTSYFGNDITPFAGSRMGGRPLRQQLLGELLENPDFIRLADVYKKTGIDEEPGMLKAMEKFPIFGRSYEYQRYTHDEEERAMFADVKVNNLEYPARLHVFGWGLSEYNELQSLSPAERVIKSHETVRYIYGSDRAEITSDVIEAIDGVSKYLGDYTTARDLISMSNKSVEEKQRILSERKGERQRYYYTNYSENESQPEDIEELLYIILRLNNKKLYEVVLEYGNVPMDSKYRDKFWLEMLDAEAESLTDEDRYYYQSAFKCNKEYLPRQVHLPDYSAAPERTETIAILSSRSNSGADIKAQLGRLFIS